MSDHDKMGLIEKSLELLPLISEFLKDQKELLVENGPSPLPPQSAMIAESVEITSLKDKLADQEKTNGFLNNQVSEMLMILEQIQSISGQPIASDGEARQVVSTLPDWIQHRMQQLADCRNNVRGSGAD